MHNLNALLSDLIKEISLNITWVALKYVFRITKPGVFFSRWVKSKFYEIVLMYILFFVQEDMSLNFGAFSK